MSERAEKDMLFVTENLMAAGYGALLHRFGSAAAGHESTEGDLDIAVVVPAAEKSGVVGHLRQLGISPNRSMNWAIDVFDCLGQTFGYRCLQPHFAAMRDRVSYLPVLGYGRQESIVTKDQRQINLPASGLACLSRLSLHAFDEFYLEFSNCSM